MLAGIVREEIEVAEEPVVNNHCRVCGRFCATWDLCKRCWDAFPRHDEMATGKRFPIPGTGAAFVVEAMR